jgi:hypothetical protein
MVPAVVGQTVTLAAPDAGGPGVVATLWLCLSGPLWPTPPVSSRFGIDSMSLTRRRCVAGRLGRPRGYLTAVGIGCAYTGGDVADYAAPMRPDRTPDRVHLNASPEHPARPQRCRVAPPGPSWIARATVL